MKDFKPSYKQYKALQYLWAVPLTREVKTSEGYRFEEILDEAGRSTYDSVTSDLGYWGAAWGGKTRLWCEWICMMCQKLPLTRWFIGREELKRLKMSTLLTMFEVMWDRWLQDWVDYNYNDVKWLISFTNWSSIRLLDLSFMPSDPLYSRFGSMEFTWWFIDEANEINPKAVSILRTRVRFMLEDFCTFCSWRIDKEKDFIRMDKIHNPDPIDNTDTILEKNRYKCPSCERETYGLLGRILNTFNPDKWRVYNTYYKPWKEWKLKSHTKFIRALATDNPYLAKSYIRTLMQSDNVTKERLLYGNFEYDASPWRLYDYEEILSMFDEQKIAPSGQKYITCDVARHGRDKAIIFAWDEWNIDTIYIYFKCDNVMLQEKIELLMQRNGINKRKVCVDEDWVWWGLTDNLWCIGFINNSSPLQPKDVNVKIWAKNNFQNLKTQAYFKLADFVGRIKINLNDVHIIGGEMSSEEIKKCIIEELDVVTEADIDKDWPKKIISKKEIKEKLGRSPDFGDNFAFRMIWELKEIKKSFSMVV